MLIYTLIYYNCNNCVLIQNKYASACEQNSVLHVVTGLFKSK